MKKQIAVLLVLGASISSNKMYADGNNSNPLLKPANKMQVSFDKLSLGSKLYVKDSDGLILYSENIESEGKYNRVFNFSSLPENDYYFEIEKQACISIYPFAVVNDSVQFNEDLRSEIIKPLLVQENNWVKLMKNLDQKQSLKVDIFYQGQDLIFSETFDNKGKVGRLYDLSNSASGEYLFRITYDDRHYSEYLSINTIY